MKKIKFLDIFIFLVAIGFGVFFVVDAKKSFGHKVKVSANNVDYEFDLNINGKYFVDGKIGKTTFEIKDKKIRVVDSPCPNKTCIHQGFAKTLVCLPNDVIIQLMEGDDGFDAIAQ